mgnify:CR=1 FL=1
MPVQQPSLYEHLFPLTTIMKQRVVERFSGDALDERWFESVILGIATFAMVDAIDEGFQIEITSAANNDRSSINFNNIRHYSHNSSVVIAVSRRVTANTAHHIGLSDGNQLLSTNNYAILRDFTGETFQDLVTSDGTTASSLASDIAINTIFHTHKLEQGSANVKLTIDGILKVTKTTNRPTVKMQPIFMVQSTSAVAGKQGRTRYLEAYNT